MSHNIVLNAEQAQQPHQDTPTALSSEKEVMRNEEANSALVEVGQ
jgi:hypothetical protein